MSRRSAAALAFVVAALAAAGSATLAQEGPSFDCAGDLSDADKLVCAEPDLAALDWQLEQRFTAAVKAIEASGGDREAAEAELRAGQRDWLASRDACATAADPHDCIRASYLQREKDLAARYDLQ